MKTMTWLLRREFWEHKGSILWAPVVVSCLLVAMIGIGMLLGSQAEHLGGAVTVDGRAIDIAKAYNSIDAGKKQQLVHAIANHYLAPTAPLFVMLAFLAFFYCLGALHDERRDRSVLFWKSLPVSDTETVLSKVITACVVTPLIVVCLSIVTSLLLMLAGAVALGFHGVNLAGPVLSNADFYLTPLRVIGLLPVYILYALPTVGWLLMVSAWAKSKVFLWAVGTPVLALIAMKWVSYLFGLGIDLNWFIHNVVLRGLAGLIPGNWFALSQFQPERIMEQGHGQATGFLFTQSWMSLASPGVWIGAAAGVAMIYAAIRLRRWKDEG